VISKHRYEGRPDEPFPIFARRVVAETQALLTEKRTKVIILGGGDEMANVLSEGFSHISFDALYSVENLRVPATEQEIIDTALPIIERSARAREARTIRTLQSRPNRNASGVVAVGDIVRALRRRKVEALVVNENSRTEFLVRHFPQRHRSPGGDRNNTLPMELKEELVSLAVLADTDVVFVSENIAKDRRNCSVWVLPALEPPRHL
jgi:hypothetical protein